MVNPQLHPLQVNPRTGEPFLQLPSPHEHIIITPLRLTDKPAIIDILNDKAVHRWLEVSHKPNPMRSACYSTPATCTGTTISLSSGACRFLGRREQRSLRCGNSRAGRGTQDKSRRSSQSTRILSREEYKRSQSRWHRCVLGRHRRRQVCPRRVGRWQ